MARIEWVAQRLENWALWHERESGGALGFASQSSFLSEAATSGFREATVPVDDVDACITNDAVESLKPDREHLYRTLHLMYLKGAGIKETARAMSRAESTIHAQLGQADVYLAEWFRDRKHRMDAQLAARRQAEAAVRAK